MKISTFVTKIKSFISSNLSLLFFVGLVSCASFSNNQANIVVYPKYSEIAYNFFSEYSIYYHKNPLKKSIDFHKTPKGIEVVIKGFENKEYKELERYLYWDVKSQKYQKLDLLPSNYNPKYESVYGNHTGFNASLYSHINFDLNYYYNYSGWHNDVIEKFEAYSGNDSYIKYSLAQAYLQSIYRAHYSETKDKKITKNDWDNALKGVSILEGLSKENFSVQTIIGDIHLKLSNDIIGIMLENRYSYWGFDEKDLLNRVVYGDFLLTLCKTIFNSCPPNTILFTHGDNDTYPFYYLQWKEGFRKDIAIVNTSLLNVSEYRDFIRKEYKIQTQIPESHFAEDKFLYGGIDDLSQDYVGFEQIKKKVLEFNYSKNNLILINDKIKYYNGLDTVKLVITQSIIYAADMAQIDIICNNGSPIFFLGESYLISTVWSTSDFMPYLKVLGNLALDYKVNKSKEVLGNFTKTTISDIKMNEFSRIEMTLYHQMYASALDILKQNNEREAYLKYANHYLNFVSSKEVLNHYSFYVLMNLLRDDILTDATKERFKILQNVLMKNIESYTSDLNIDEFVIEKIDNTLFALVQMNQLLGKPLQPEFKQNLIGFFNRVYEKQPYLKQTVINQRILYNFLEND